MFDIIIHYFMRDTVRLTTDRPLFIMATLDMRQVSTIEIACNVE